MKDKIKNIWEEWGYLLIIVFIIFIIFFGAVFYAKNSSKELIHQTGVVIDQEHRHWTTITYIRNNNVTIPQVVHHDAWDTKVQIDNEDTIFTDSRKNIYDTTSIGSKVKVLRYDYYFKGKYTGTNYYVDMEK
jgi:hypothetical protein